MPNSRAGLLVQGLLHHTVIKDADELEGMYKQAFDRIINQVSLQGSLPLCLFPAVGLQAIIAYVTLLSTLL